MTTTTNDYTDRDLLAAMYGIDAPQADPPDKSLGPTAQMISDVLDRRLGTDPLTGALIAMTTGMTRSEVYTYVRTVIDLRELDRITRGITVILVGDPDARNDPYDGIVYACMAVGVDGEIYRLYWIGDDPESIDWDRPSYARRVTVNAYYDGSAITILDPAGLDPRVSTY